MRQYPTWDFQSAVVGRLVKLGLLASLAGGCCLGMGSINEGLVEIQLADYPSRERHSVNLTGYVTQISVCARSEICVVPTTVYVSDKYVDLSQLTDESEESWLQRIKDVERSRTTIGLQPGWLRARECLDIGHQHRFSVNANGRIVGVIRLD